MNVDSLDVDWLTLAASFVEGMDWHVVCPTGCDACDQLGSLTERGLLKRWDNAYWVTPKGMDALASAGVIERPLTPPGGRNPRWP